MDDAAGHGERQLYSFGTEPYAGVWAGYSSPGIRSYLRASSTLRARLILDTRARESV
jgi:hypothetical protein